MIIGEKNLLLLIIGAGISALVGAYLIQWVTQASRIKEDTAMGIVLSVFFGFGIMLLTIVNRTTGGNQAGLDKFIFGQAATMLRSDVYMMMVLALVVVLIITLSFKEWKIYLFDPNFAKGQGLSIKGMNAAYTALLVMTIVMGIQAVGVILMAAMLIIPAVSARYWTNSFARMLLLSASFGGLSGAIGTLVSTLGSGWPTGPFIVVTASSIFVLSILFGLRKGWLTQLLERRMKKKQVSRKTPVSRHVLKEEH